MISFSIQEMKRWNYRKACHLIFLLQLHWGLRQPSWGPGPAQTEWETEGLQGEASLELWAAGLHHGRRLARILWGEDSQAQVGLSVVCRVWPGIVSRLAVNNSWLRGSTISSWRLGLMWRMTWGGVPSWDKPSGGTGSSWWTPTRSGESSRSGSTTWWFPMQVLCPKLVIHLP